MFKRFRDLTDEQFIGLLNRYSIKHVARMYKLKPSNIEQRLRDLGRNPEDFKS